MFYRYFHTCAVLTDLPGSEILPKSDLKGVLLNSLVLN